MEETGTHGIDNILIKSSEIEISRDDVLGRGGYGIVYRGHFKSDGQIIAVKLLISDGILPKRNLRDLEREARRLKQLTDHPNILNMYGALMESSCYGLVLEYMHFGSSANFVKDFHVDMPLLLRITHQVIEAMAFLHSHDPPIFHLDLKADNILINNFLDAKICDFGVSEWRTVTQSVTGVARRCTISHIAPEVLENINAPSTKALDIYAFGITLWELFSAQEVYSGRAENLVRESVLNNQRPDLTILPPQTIHVQTIMARCWQKEQNQRPQFSTLKEDIAPLYSAYQRHLPAALKSVRRQICEKFAVNDEEFIHTEHIDEIEVELTEETIDHTSINVSIQPPSLMETDQPNTLAPAAPVIAEVSPPPVRLPVPVKGHVSSDPYVVHPDKKYESSVDKEFLKVIFNSIDLDSNRPGEALSYQTYFHFAVKISDMKELQKSVNSDSRLRAELMRSNSPLFNAIHRQRTRHSRFQSKLWQKEGKLEDTQKFYSYTKHQNPADMSEVEKRRYDRMMDLRVCSYGKKLAVGGIGEKLIKALREPHYLNRTLQEPDPKPGEPKKFNVIDEKVKELARDPMILQIVLSQEPEILDNLMRQFPDMVMNLLAKGKTQYRPWSERRHWRMHDREMSYMVRMMRHRDRDDYHDRRSRHMMDDSDDDDFGMPIDPMMMMGMGSSRERRQQEEMMSKIAADRKKREKEEREKREKEEKQKQKKLEQQNKKEKEAFRFFKWDRKEKETSKDKSKESKKDREKAEIEALKQKTALDLKQKEIERLRELQRKRKEDEENSKTENTGPLNMLEMLQRPMLKRENALNSQPASAVPSMDQLSMEEDPSTSSQPSPAKQTKDSAKDPVKVKSERQEASAVPPSVSHSKSPSPKPVKVEPTAASAPQAARGDNVIKDTKEEKMEIDASPASPDEGNVKAEAPLTIHHTHADGGKTRISVRTNIENVPNLQIGNKNTMVVLGSGKEEEEPSKKKKPTKKMDLSKFPEALLNSDNIDTIAVEIGKDWRRLCRELDLSEAEIEQLHHDFQINGLYEVVYQALQRWIQRKGRAATVRLMAKNLWTIGRDDLALQLKK